MVNKSSSDIAVIVVDIVDVFVAVFLFVFLFEAIAISEANSPLLGKIKVFEIVI